MRSRAASGMWADAAVLALVQALTVGAFVARLGFSSDDWWFLARMHASAGDGLLDLHRAAQSGFHAMRTVFIGWLALLFKLWGMTAVFHAFGLWLLRRVSSRRAAPLHAACVGLVALGVLKFFPWVGVVGWTAATLIGIGATVLTKFGRGGPWFSADAAAA